VRAEVIRKIVEDWINSQVGPHRWGVAFDDTTLPYIMSALDYLSREAGYSKRHIHRLLHQQEWISLFQADKLLTAIELHHLLANGEIDVVPNPAWTLEEWATHMRKRGC
jgi:hypothetical protein